MTSGISTSPTPAPIIAPTPAPTIDRRVGGYRVVFVLMTLAVLVFLLMLPLGIGSVLREAVTPAHDSVHPFTPANGAMGDNYTQVHIDVTAINEVERTATLRLTGFRYCKTTCNFQDKLLFFSVQADDRAAQSVPSSEAFALPTTSTEVTGKIQMPLEGNLIAYPFDRYPLWLGVVIERQLPDKTTKILTPDETKGLLRLTFQEHVSRMELASFRTIDPASVRPAGAPFDYAYVGAITTQRPLYLRIVVVMVVFLVALAAVMAVTMRPFDQLILNAGALVLGVWGARSMLLGGFPADSTLVDITLTLIIQLLLGVIAVRALVYLYTKSAFPSSPGRGCSPRPGCGAGGGDRMRVPAVEHTAVGGATRRGLPTPAVSLDNKRPRHANQAWRALRSAQRLGKPGDRGLSSHNRARFHHSVRGGGREKARSPSPGPWNGC